MDAAPERFADLIALLEGADAADVAATAEGREAAEAAVALLDAGEVRLAEPPADGDDPDGPWHVNAWLQVAIGAYFRLRGLTETIVGPFHYFDKVPLKTDLAARGVRVVPPATVRHGAFVEPGAVLMPSYVNIGARVGAGSLVDTWATVGSGAQVGRDVHVAGGVGLGGVLEPPGAVPVIVEDGAFLGSRVIAVEGVRVGHEAVLGAGVTVTGSTRILDVTGDEVVEHVGRIPARAVVIPGVRRRRFPAGEYGVLTPLIVGYRTERTDRKVSLNAALRTFDVPV